MPISNTDRTTGAMLSGEVARLHGHAGLPDDTIWVTLNGTAGQSFGAWLAKGVTLDLVGEANDYVGKGLSGGRIIVRPSERSGIVPEESIIVGNTVLYGAITGECYFRGIAGERFAVRNSGAVAVVEGTGDHGCEYMTGGVVVVLGPTGRNFAAGMSGGIAYVYDPKNEFSRRCNPEFVALERVEDDRDVEELTALIHTHHHHTGSDVAAKILDNWERMQSRFVKVMPRDYKKVLAAMHEANRTGVPWEKAVMEAAHG
jgi:glutamate synthase domain-containing protein 3